MYRTKLRRALAPTVLTGLLSATMLAAAPGSSAATPPAMAGPAATMQRALSAQLSPYRVVPGARLQVKAPTFVLPVKAYRLTGRFGASSSLWSSSHTGLDFAAPEGTEIRAIAAGTVAEVAYDGAYGTKTTVRLDDGTVLWFCHQSDTAVPAGKRVAAGQLLGYVGSTGNVTGSHLHLEVRPGDGDPVDPADWLAEHSLRA